jgi:hypothetical protein
MTALIEKAFKFYKTFIAIKLHFKNEGYDYFVSDGRVRATEASFTKRNDKYFFEKLAYEYDFEQFVNKCLAEVKVNRNFSPKDLLSKNNENRYFERKKILEAFLPVLDREMSEVFTHCLVHKITFSDVFEGTETTKPMLFIFYQRGMISDEVYACLDDVFDLSVSLAKFSLDPLVEEVSQFIEKYRPFISQYFPSNHLVKEKITGLFDKLNTFMVD